MSIKRHRGTAALKRITALAKKIRAAHPTKKWTNCIKEAAKRLK